VLLAEKFTGNWILDPGLKKWLIAASLAENFKD
jgi:hypothetical protein